MSYARNVVRRIEQWRVGHHERDVVDLWRAKRVVAVLELVLELVRRGEDVRMVHHEHVQCQEELLVDDGRSDARQRLVHPRIAHVRLQLAHERVGKRRCARVQCVQRIERCLYIRKHTK